jgi:hypothetical protein
VAWARAHTRARARPQTHTHTRARAQLQPHRYDLTSIIATARKLLGLPPTPLTRRDSWAATFDHLLSLDAPREDCPMYAHARNPLWLVGLCGFGRLRRSAYVLFVLWQAFA